MTNRVHKNHVCQAPVDMVRTQQPSQRTLACCHCICCVSLQPAKLPNFSPAALARLLVQLQPRIQSLAASVHAAAAAPAGNAAAHLQLRCSITNQLLKLPQGLRGTVELLSAVCAAH
jgi:hypothetical protein